MAFKILVCAKQVPDTNVIKINPKTGTLIRDGVPSILNHDDANALEEALKIKDKFEDVTVTVISMGPPQAADLLFENSYIRHVHKAACGITILRALENYRIERAKEMLARHTMRHSEIAAATGFSDPYYFSKRFKQIVGCTPTKYEGMMYHE